MSRKNFIITALLINLTICVTLCIVVFTDKDNTGSVEPTKENIVEEENSKVLENEPSTSKKEEETDNIGESQTQSDTPPVTYIDYNGITLNNQEDTTTEDNQEETTTPVETTVFVNGTMATIIQSCNIRSQADLSSGRIGTAILGSSYRIEPTLCFGNWTAIYLEDNTIGYVSTSFCSIS